MKHRILAFLDYDPTDWYTDDHPNTFYTLPPDRRRALEEWIAEHVRPASRVLPASSYVLKHAAEDHLGGWVGNGHMKGAMRHAGHEPVDPLKRNWKFRIRVRAEQALGAE